MSGVSLETLKRRCADWAPRDFGCNLSVMLCDGYALATDGKGMVAVKGVEGATVEPHSTVAHVFRTNAARQASGRIRLSSLRNAIRPRECPACDREGCFEAPCDDCSERSGKPESIWVSCPCMNAEAEQARMFGATFNTRLLWLFLRGLPGESALVVLPDGPRSPLVIRRSDWLVLLMPIDPDRAVKDAREISVKVAA